MGPRKLVPLLAVAPIFMRSPREGGQKGSSPPPWPEGDPGSWNSSRFSETLGPLTANQPLSLRVFSLSLSLFFRFFFFSFFFDTWEKLVRIYERLLELGLLEQDVFRSAV